MLLSNRSKFEGRMPKSIIDRMFFRNRLSFAEYFVRFKEFTAEEVKKLKRLG